MTEAIRPQPGPQEQFLATPADIAIYGGAAFGGKTFALLLEAMRHQDNAQFGGVIFRRTTKQIMAEGGLWDTAGEIYPLIGADPNMTRLSWSFKSGAKITFSHLEHESDKFNWQGSQIAFIGFDELTHFTAGQFWYMLSRNRSMSGVRPYIRATCNPDPDSFVAELIAWWIDPATGVPIPERSGVVRWFIRYHNELVWADNPDELRERYPGSEPKSLTFIAASYRDNKIGLEKDPGYMANLDALPKVERERLKSGNWKIKPAAGDYFQETWFEIVERAPEVAKRVRYWDRAATEPNPENPDPDWTVGVKLSKDPQGVYYVEDVRRKRHRPAGVRALIKGTTQLDGVGCAVVLEHDPGQAGKVEADIYIKDLSGFDVHAIPPQGDKETRARPASSQAEACNIKIVRGEWNKAFLDELENFPKGKHDDQVDGLSGALNWLESNNIQPAAGSTVEPEADHCVPEAMRGRRRLEMLGRAGMGRMHPQRSL
ncbi:MAG: phage terminase large subunit [Pseudomonadota bacterium]